MNDGSNATGSPGVRVALFLALSFAVVAAFVVGFYREPQYQGRPLLDWVQQLDTPGDQKAAQAAVSAIGPKAVPFLLSQVRRGGLRRSKPTFSNTLWRSLPAQLKEFVPLPDSDLLLNQVPIALSLLGPAVLPELVSAAQDSNADVQFAAVQAIGMIGPPADSALPVLIQLVGQTNNVRGIAALAIGQMGPAKTQAIGALITALPSTEVQAGRTLGGMGPEARAAVPVLTTLLDSPKEYVRVQAATALWQITQRTNLVGWIIEELERRKRFVNYENYKGYLNLLGEMGPMARSAVPAILKTMTNWGTDMSRPVRPVLAKIDPEAAAALNRKAIRSQTQVEVVRRPVYPISGDW